MKKIINLIKVTTLLFFCPPSFAQKLNYSNGRTMKDTVVSEVVHGFELYGFAPSSNYIESMYGNEILARDFINEISLKCQKLNIKLLKSNFTGNIIDFKFLYSDTMQVDYRIFLHKDENNSYVTNGKEIKPVKTPNYSHIEYTFGKFRSFYDKWKKDNELEFAKAAIQKDGGRKIDHKMCHDNDSTFQLYSNLVAHLIKADLDIPQCWSMRLSENLSFRDNLQCFKEKLIMVGLHPKKGKLVEVDNGKRIYSMGIVPPHHIYFEPLFAISKNWQED